MSPSVTLPSAVHHLASEVANLRPLSGSSQNVRLTGERSESGAADRWPFDVVSSTDAVDRDPPILAV